MKGFRRFAAGIILTLVPATALAAEPTDHGLIGDRATQWARRNGVSSRESEITLPNGKKVRHVAVPVTPDKWHDFKQTFKDAGKKHQDGVRAALKKNSSPQAMAYLRAQPSGVIAVHLKKETAQLRSDWIGGRWQKVQLPAPSVDDQFHALTGKQIVGRRPERLAPVQSRFISTSGGPRR